jgi:hypothetical protein
MRSLPAILLLVFLNGCAGLNIDPPERWVEGNVLYSTKWPSAEIHVDPSLRYNTSKNAVQMLQVIENNNTSWQDSEEFSFADASEEKHLVISISSLHNDVRFYYIKSDFSKNKEAFTFGTEKIAGTTYNTGVLVIGPDRNNKNAVMLKVYDAVVADATRYRFYYLEKVGAGWLRKKPQMFDTADRDFLVAFEQRANESFSITPYGRNVPPSKRL